jgi:hypothetical protein
VAQFQIAVHMIGMMVGGQDMGELPAALFQGIGDGPGFRRIDADGGASLMIVNQNAEIVVAAGELVDFEMGHDCPSVAAELARKQPCVQLRFADGRHLR